jgi:peptidoglycan/LPS O-acetylase OafA/YrhL
VLFSLLLPAIVVLVIYARRRLWMLIVLAAFAIGVGAEFQNGALIYLPVFVVGASIAAALPYIRSMAERFSRVRLAGLWWTLFLIAGGLALISFWLFRPLANTHHVVASGFSAVGMLGAAAIVVVAAVWTPFVSLLSTPVIQWLGRVSFSLYLIHQIALSVFTAMFGARLWWVTALCTVVTSLLCAKLFARFVEQPAHRLSKRVGAALSHRVHQTLPIPDTSKRTPYQQENIESDQSSPVREQATVASEGSDSLEVGVELPDALSRRTPAEEARAIGTKDAKGMP